MRFPDSFRTPRIVNEAASEVAHFRIHRVVLVAAAVIALMGVWHPVEAQDRRIVRVCGGKMPTKISFDNQEHLLWYNRFWTGACDSSLSFCSEGSPNWIEAMSLLESQVPKPKRLKLRARLCAVGYKVGHEWARDNGIRRISTEDLDHFYSILQDGSSDVFTRLDEVDQQANERLHPQ